MAKKHDDLLYRIKTDLLYQPFLEILNTVLNNCAKKGYYFIATSGYRSPEEQAALYAKGRNGNTEPRATNAKPFSSYHNLGAACDFFCDKSFKSEKVTVSYKDEDLVVLADEALKQGLDAGFYWKSLHDAPHLNLNVKKHNIKLPDLKKQYEKGGLKQVFAYLDKFSW